MPKEKRSFIISVTAAGAALKDVRITVKLQATLHRAHFQLICLGQGIHYSV